MAEILSWALWFYAGVGVGIFAGGAFELLWEPEPHYGRWLLTMLVLAAMCALWPIACLAFARSSWWRMR